MTRKNNAKKKRKASGRPFEKGRPGGPGRPPGVPNKATREVRERYRAILENPTYLEWLQRKILSGRASDQLLTLVHHYAYGRPAQAVDLNASVDLLKYLARQDEAPDQ